MDPKGVFCANPACADRGVTDKGNIKAHSRKERRLAGLTRRGRRQVKDEGALSRGMHLVGCVYNFCDAHRSLRVKQERGKKWAERTPAMAAGWTDHAWSVHELLSFRVLHG